MTNDVREARAEGPLTGAPPPPLPAGQWPPGPRAPPLLQGCPPFPLPRRLRPAVPSGKEGRAQGARGHDADEDEVDRRPEARGRGAPLEEPAHQEDVDDAPELARSHEAAGAEVLRDGEGAGGDGVEGDGHQGQDGGPEQGVRGAQGPEAPRAESGDEARTGDGGDAKGDAHGAAVVVGPVEGGGGAGGRGEPPGDEGGAERPSRVGPVARRADPGLDGSQDAVHHAEAAAEDDQEEQVLAVGQQRPHVRPQAGRLGARRRGGRGPARRLRGAGRQLRLGVEAEEGRAQDAAGGGGLAQEQRLPAPPRGQHDRGGEHAAHGHPTQLESAATAVAAAVSRNHAAAIRGGVFLNTGCTAAATVWPARRTPYARGPGGSQQASARSAQASRLPQPPPSRHARRPQRCTSAAQTAEAGT